MTAPPSFNRAELRALIERSGSLPTFVRTTVIERVPWIFDGLVTSFDTWRAEVAKAVSVQPDAIVVVGSECANSGLRAVSADY